MIENNLEIIATTVTAENFEIRKENCAIEDLIQFLNLLNCRVSIEVTVLERGKLFGCN